MINRSFLSLLFVFLLLFAQQQALVHPLEHFADAQQKSSNHKNTLPHSDNCAKCAALAGVASALASKSQPVIALNATFELICSVTQSLFSQSFHPYQSRAPPYLA
jgi:hypothetical protein